MEISDQIKEIEEIFFQKFSIRVNVHYDEVDNLGNWFYLNRGLYGKYRLGTTLHNAVSMIGYMDDIPSGLQN